MSVVSAPDSLAFFRNQTLSDPDIDASKQTHPPPKGIAGIEPGTFVKSKSSGRKKKMTEKGKAYQLELKFANRNSAYKVLKEQIEIIMYQSIPSAIIPPPGNPRAFDPCSAPHSGAFDANTNPTHRAFDPSKKCWSAVA